MSNKELPPKLFISYSWSNPDHEAWVVQFSEELMSKGIDVALDKWDLKPGHDAVAFMEGMITDPSITKVLLICDQVYADKSNGREGGAGTEAQIVTTKIYAESTQERFVAVVRERDQAGKACLPVYYGNRIYFDLTNPSTYGEDFEKIIRWVWDEQVHQKPTIGAKPKFLSESSAPRKIQSSGEFRRAMEALRIAAPNANALLTIYLDLVATGLEAFRISGKKDPAKSFDEIVLESIEEFLPIRTELLELFSAIALYHPTEDILSVLHRFFEKCIPYKFPSPNAGSWHEWEFDNFHFIIHELFLYCLGAFIKYEKFDAGAFLIDNEYYYRADRNPDYHMHSFTIFRDFMKSLKSRNERLKLSRLSIRADMLHDRNKGTGIDFHYIMAADFVLYLRGLRSETWNRWWPETLLYSIRFGGAFEMFARAKSTRYLMKILPMIGMANKEEINILLTSISTDKTQIPTWQFERISPETLMNFKQLGTTP